MKDIKNGPLIRLEQYNSDFFFSAEKNFSSSVNNIIKQLGYFLKHTVLLEFTGIELKHIHLK